MENILILSEDGKEVIGVKEKTIIHVTIPNGVTSIGGIPPYKVGNTDVLLSGNEKSWE